MSEKKAEASRINGTKSRGPKSKKGKDNAKFNALTSGLFSQQLVIEAIGERKEDFDAIKLQVWSYFQPANVVEEMLAAELVESWWRRLRIRRSETAEVERTLLELKLGEDVRREAEVYSLQNRFVQLFAARTNSGEGSVEGSAELQREKDKAIYRLAANLARKSGGEDPSLSLDELAARFERNAQAREQRNPSPAVQGVAQAAEEIEGALEEVRSQLASTSQGLMFLKDTVSSVRAEVEAKGELSDPFVILLQACCGVDDLVYRYCFLVNAQLRKGKVNTVKSGETESKTATPAGPNQGDSKLGKGTGEVTIEDEGRGLLRSFVTLIIKRLDMEMQRLAAIEAEEKRLKIAASGLPSSDLLNRVSRAEAAVERRFHRALVLLMMLKNPELNPRLLSN